MLKFESFRNIFWIIQTNIANGFTFKHLLSLVEFFLHKLVKIVREHVILILCQLHRHHFFLDFAEDVIGLARLKVSFHVHFLLKLSCDEDEVLIVALIVRKELELSKLEHFGFVVIDLVLILIGDFDDLVVFF